MNQKKWPNRDQLWRVECRLPIRDGSHSRLSIPIFLAETPKLRLSVAAPGQNSVKFLAASLFTDILRRSLKIITLPSMNPWWIIHYQVCLDAFPNSSKFYLCLQAVTTKLEMTRTTIIEISARIIQSSQFVVNYWVTRVRWLISDPVWTRTNDYFDRIISPTWELVGGVCQCRGMRQCHDNGS